MIGPMTGSSSMTPAITASRTAYLEKTGSTRAPRTSRPTNVAAPTTRPRISWPRTQDPNTRRMIPSVAQVSARHAAGTAWSKARTILGRSRRIQNVQTGMIRYPKIEPTNPRTELKTGRRIVGTSDPMLARKSATALSMASRTSAGRSR